MKKSFLFILFFFFLHSLFAQQDSLLKRKADSLLAINPAEALAQYQLYLTKSLKKSSTFYLDIFAAYDSAYKGAIAIKNYAAAEKFVTQVFEFAREKKNNIAIAERLPAIVSFYQQAQKNNWQLSHEIKIGNLRSILLEVSDVKYLSKDSAVLTISGGSVEGLYKGLAVEGIGTKLPFLNVDRSDNILGRGVIIDVTFNSARVAFRQSYKQDSSDNIYPKDLIQFEAASVLKKDLGDYQVLVDDNIKLTDNYKAQPYGLRQLAFYNIPNHQTLIDSFYLYSVSEITDIIKDDTLGQNQRIKGGFYKGSLLSEAMNKTDLPHIRAFLKFIKQYPGKYVGQRFRFSEVYATWLINDSPLDDQALMELLTEYYGTPFYNECLKVYAEKINSNEWLRWKDNFIDSLDNDVFLKQPWDILQNTAAYFNNPVMHAWNKLLTGRIAAYNKNPAAASINIKEAKGDFEKLKLSNEALFAENTLTQVNNQRVAKVALQTNHTLPFSVSYSPDGKYFATYGEDYTIKLWDAKLVRQIEAISAHLNTINQVIFTPNSRFFISASDDGFIRVWTTRSMRLYKEINTNYRVKYATLNKTGDKIITAGSDSSIHVYNFESGAEEKRYPLHKAAINTADYNPDFQQIFYTGGNDSMSYIVNLETGNWNRWFKNAGKISAIKATEDRQYFSALSNDGKIKLWRQNGDFLAWYPTTVYKFRDYAPTIPGFDINTRKKTIAFVNENGLLTLGSLDSLNYYPYNLKFEGNILDIKFHPSGNSLLVTTSLGKLYFVNLIQYNLVNGSNIQSKLVGSNATGITAISFSQNDDMLAYQSGSTYILNLSTGKNISFGEESYSQLRSNIYFTHHDSSLLYVPLDAKQLQEKNIFSQDSTFGVIKSPGSIAFHTLSPDGKLIAILIDKKSFNIYERNTAKLLYQIPVDSIGQTQIKSALFIPGTNKIVTINDKGFCVSFYEMNSEMQKPFYRLVNSQGYQFGSACYYPSHNTIIVPSQDNKIYFLDAETGVTKDSVDFNYLDKEEGINIVKLHPDGHTLFIGQNNHMMIYDLETKKVVQDFSNKNYAGGVVQFSHDGKTLAVGSLYGIIYLFDTKNYKKLLEVQTFTDADPVWITPDNYYIASRSGLQSLYFNYNHTLYPFDQFDINFNRPDTVLQRLGKIDNTLLAAYKEAWVKRFKKSGISADKLRPDFKVPELKILNEEEIPAFVNTNASVGLQMQLKDDNAKITSYNLWINGVPLYGKEGKKLVKPQSTATVSDSLILSGINNVIQASCKNENGVESLKEKFEIKNYVKDTTPYKTYLFCVSVSNYKDKKYSLKYARKDGRDFVNAFKKEYGNNIYVDTLFDEKATLQNILSWKKIMEKTNIKDRVILYVSGHGLLDKNYDFYYATYDIDFKNPADKGLAYDDIEKLLDKIPARKKLLLMDACHSGEVDKDATGIKIPENSVAKSEVKKVNVVYKSKGVDEDGESNSNLGLKNSFELMQELFTNLNNGNGTVVISAAAGNSYAYESDVWNNGIFTYCLLHGLKDKAADYDGDQRISVSELQKFVSSEVQRLTQGAQKPTARQENLDNDWLVW